MTHPQDSDDQVADEAPVETVNDHMLSTNGETFQFLMPPVGPMTREEVIRTAAWMVALADPSQERFGTVLAAVCST